MRDALLREAFDAFEDALSFIEGSAEVIERVAGAVAPDAAAEHRRVAERGRAAISALAALSRETAAA